MGGVESKPIKNNGASFVSHPTALAFKGNPSASQEGDGGEAAKPLENIANNPTPPTRRAERYALRQMLWTYSNLPRLRNCGRARHGDYVGVRHGAGVAGFSGLQSCGSVWACPVCSAKISARRSLEIGCGLLSWETSGGRLVMGTLTMRHHKGHRLADSWAALNKAWDSVNRSRIWKKWRDRLGSPGLVRVVEVTYGANGWHVHVHFVMCIAAESVVLVDEFRAWLLEKWARAIAAQGFPGALDVGQDVHLIDGPMAAASMGDYLSKATAFYGAAEQMGRELMGSWTKGARGSWSTVPAWRIAETFQATGEADLLDLWHEYERSSKGKRQLTWSRGLRDVLVLEPERSDDEIAAEELGTKDLIRLDRHAWAAVLRLPQPTNYLLELVEQHGIGALKKYLRKNGIVFADLEGIDQ